MFRKLSMIVCAVAVLIPIGGGKLAIALPSMGSVDIAMRPLPGIEPSHLLLLTMCLALLGVLEGLHRQRQRVESGK